MTDRTDRLNAEEQAIEQALSQAMATGGEPRLLRGGDGRDAAMVREYTELLGLLPYELPAETPPAQVKEQLLAKIAGMPATGMPATGMPATGMPATGMLATGAPAAGSAEPPRDLDDLTLFTPAEPPDAVDMTLRRPVAAAAVADLEEPPPAAPFLQPAPVSHPAWGTWAMAAVLALCLVGLGFLSSLVWQQSRQIEQLNGRLVASADQSEMVRAREQLRTLQGRLDMITTVAQEAYPLRRVGRTTAPNQPHGVVYVCGNHQRWYLTLRGLERPVAGEEYRLWFMTDQGKVDGGTLEVRPDASSEREALTMPAGTQGFAVTLEKQGPRDEPESLTILLGENAVKL